MEQLTLVSSSACFNGYQKVFSHKSAELKCQMRFAIYLPARASLGIPLPVIYWLSDMNCNEKEFITKSGVQKYASEHQMIIVCPDTSPRGEEIPGSKEGRGYGQGASFYIDATEQPWKENYRMFTYITRELYDLIPMVFPGNPSKQSIMGDGMGGHGALICALKKPGHYRCVSVFAPICHPIENTAAVKAFIAYLGSKTITWEDWDAVELVKKYEGPRIHICIDQGEDDKLFTQKQLMPQAFAIASLNVNVECVIKFRKGYDHSYDYISSFLAEHVRYHANFFSQ